MDPALQRGLVLDQVQAEAGELTLLADARVGQPDRRHQVAVTEHRKDLRVDLVGLAGQRRETLDLLGVSDLDRPALLLEGVVDDPRASHRLDHGADRLAVDLLDAASEPSKRVDVGRYGELVQMLSLIGEQTHVELLATQIQSSVQHVNGPPRGWFSMTSGACHRGGPPSWQSDTEAQRWVHAAGVIRPHAERITAARVARPTQSTDAQTGTSLSSADGQINFRPDWPGRKQRNETFSLGS